MKFIDEIKARAKQDVKTIVLPESRDKRTLIAAAQVLKEGTAKIVMVGDEEKIRDGAHWLDVELEGISVVNPETSPKLDEYVNLLYELRKKKGMTLESAREQLLNNYIMFGVMMVKCKDADGMVAGCCHATADVHHCRSLRQHRAQSWYPVSLFWMYRTVSMEQTEPSCSQTAD